MYTEAQLSRTTLTLDELARLEDTRLAAAHLIQRLSRPATSGSSSPATPTQSSSARTRAGSCEPSGEGVTSPSHSGESNMKRITTIGIIAFAALIGLTGLSAPAAAAPVGGPAAIQDRVQAYSTNTYTVVLRGGELTIISGEGDGDTDLDLYVYDENGYLIASDLGLSDSMAVSFTPSWTGIFYIEVRNHGPVYNEFVLGAW